MNEYKVDQYKRTLSNKLKYALKDPRDLDFVQRAILNDEKRSTCTNYKEGKCYGKMGTRKDSEPPRFILAS